MVKFHINSKGVPAPCKAKNGKCPFGGESDHYKTKEEAQKIANKRLEEENSFFPTISQGEIPNLSGFFSEKHKDILRRLESSGFQAYFVGGSLRDAIIGEMPHDVDITTSASPEEVMEVFKDFPIIPLGLEHGTVAVMIDGEPIEITTFRTEGKYSDSRRPDSVEFTKSLEEDLQRRDFTINALAYSESGLVDLVGGQADIENKLIRAVGDPNERFKEDPLRILRGLRFASKLGFNIEENTEKAMIENAELLNKISKERIRQEFDGIISGGAATETLKEYPNVISVFLPEMKASIGFEQQNPYHSETVWGHTADVVGQAKDDPVHKLAAIFHDLGKPSAYKFNKEKNTASYLGHAEESAKLAEQAMRRLKYDRRTIDRVLKIVETHGNDLSTKEYNIKKKLYNNGIEAYMDLVDFKEADDKSKLIFDLSKYNKIRKFTDAYLASTPILTHKDLNIPAKKVVDAGYKNEDIKKKLDELAYLVMSGNCENNEISLSKWL